MRMALFVSIVCFGAAHAPAATINSINKFTLPGFSTGSVGPVGITPAVNNDDHPGASPNLINYSIFLNSPGGLETEFNLAASGGTTEYRFTQNFFNNTATVWTGFLFELGQGTGGNFTPFPASAPIRFDLFAGQSTATSSKFTLAIDQTNLLRWSSGNVPRFSSASFTFAIDVPDGLTQFTLRQTPLSASSVPEPSTISLAGLALAGVALKLRRSSQARHAARTTSTIRF